MLKSRCGRRAGRRSNAIHQSLWARLSTCHSQTEKLLNWTTFSIELSSFACEAAWVWRRIGVSFCLDRRLMGYSGTWGPCQISICLKAMLKFWDLYHNLIGALIHCIFRLWVIYITRVGTPIYMTSFFPFLFFSFLLLRSISQSKLMICKFRGIDSIALLTSRKISFNKD